MQEKAILNGKIKKITYMDIYFNFNKKNFKILNLKLFLESTW